MAKAFRSFLDQSDMMAYVAMMGIRLLELHRVLKPTGSIYLHCDPTASHYLKLLMDAVFGPANFVNEIVWQRTNAHNMRTKGFVRANDVLLMYGKSSEFIFNEQYTEYGPEQMKRFRPDVDGRLYKAENLTFSTANLSRQFEWRGVKPPSNRSWGYSEEKLEELWQAGRILVKADGRPRMDGLKIYLDETTGKPLTTNWTDIPRISNTAGERLGYPTQKPLALLERIIKDSSKEGDIVLDPFCGCGTAVHAAQQLKRKWIGIDITCLAIGLIEKRLKNAFSKDLDFEVHGTPKDLESARDLAARDKYQFQWWAVTLVDAQPFKGKKKGADTGIDGLKYFYDLHDKDAKTIVISVKGGGLKADDVRALNHVREREKAEIGAMISLNQPTSKMLADAASAGFYVNAVGQRIARIQWLTIEGLLAGNERLEHPDYVPDVNYKRAKAAKPKHKQTDWTANLKKQDDESE